MPAASSEPAPLVSDKQAYPSEPRLTGIAESLDKRVARLENEWEIARSSKEIEKFHHSNFQSDDYGQDALEQCKRCRERHLKCRVYRDDIRNAVNKRDLWPRVGLKLPTSCDYCRTAKTKCSISK